MDKLHSRMEILNNREKRNWQRWAEPRKLWDYNKVKKKNGVPGREENDTSKWIVQLQSTEDLLNLIYNDVVKTEHKVMNTFLWRNGLFIQRLT